MCIVYTCEIGITSSFRRKIKLKYAKFANDVMTLLLNYTKQFLRKLLLIYFIFLFSKFWNFKNYTKFNFVMFCHTHTLFFSSNLFVYFSIGEKFGSLFKKANWLWMIWKKNKIASIKQHQSWKINLSKITKISRVKKTRGNNLCM